MAGDEMTPDDQFKKDVREALTEIRSEVKMIVRLEERVHYQEVTLARFGGMLDTHGHEISNIKAKVEGNNISSNDIKSVVKWTAGIIAAIFIATYLNSNRFQQPVLQPHNHTKVVPDKGKKDDFTGK